MKRLAICAWAGFVAYALTLFFSGPAGYSSMKRLDAEKARINANLKELQGINESLALRAEALRSDPETIRIESRKYGFIGTGERLVQVNGLKTPKQYHLAGKLLAFRPLPTQGGFYPICAACLVSVVVLLLSYSAGEKRKTAA